MTESGIRLNKDTLNYLYDNVIKIGEWHIVGEYRDYPDHLPKLLLSLYRLMYLARPYLIEEVVQESNPNKVKRHFWKSMNYLIEYTFRDFDNHIKYQKNYKAWRGFDNTNRKIKNMMNIFIFRLELLRKEIESNNSNLKCMSFSGKAVPETRLAYWSGAGIFVTNDPSAEVPFNKELCLTPYAYEITQLWIRVRDADPGLINHLNKFAFYGAMADALNQIQKKDRDTSERDVLLAILDAGIEFLSYSIPPCFTGF
ncbi:hypothetical protein FJM67_08125 [Maribrevibacterium harenarium]|uniref:Uncharacterized protein n=1 Tax=Maribrevibacterium harenarium TaxID=2589817 RepID=A0A501WWX7_9GAMM|nr:hypothetical protein [Maribrevibacterium harenarium]TPE51937.1 hypothetical protein FJM67_08125 [Maribrevibacterium harenarium]